MTWYSVASEFAAKHLAALRPSEPLTNGEEEAADVNGAENLLLLAPHTATRPRHGFSAEFFRAGRMAWLPSFADRIYEAFDVSQPVAQPEDLRGREKELKRLLGGVLHRRNHGIVSGPRGSGKTSLVRVFGQYADREGIVVLYAACDSGTKFGELLRDFLEQIPSSSVNADEVELLERRVMNFGADSSPHQATSIFAQIEYSKVAIVVDEFDRIRDPEMHSKMASLLKLISDSRLPVRFVLVGGSGTLNDVVSHHPSLMRHITCVSTDPLSSEAVGELLDKCAGRCDMRFSDGGKRLVQQVACGSPYHARLFGMHAALKALLREDQQIIERDVVGGLAESFEEWAFLNRDDAGIFRAIIDGSHGDSTAYVEIAKKIALADQELGKISGTTKNGANPRGSHEQILSAFGSALEQSADGIFFRDSTAPQFLIALQRVSRPSKSIPQPKGGAGA